MNDEASFEPGEPTAEEIEARDKLGKLVRRDDYLVGDPEDLVHFDWSPYIDGSAE